MKENRTLAKITREALSRYGQRGAHIDNDLIAAMLAVQDSAGRTGLDNLTERDIDAEVTAHRRQRAAREQNKL